MLMNNITTERLFLNEITEEDFDFLFRIDSIPECDEYNTLGIPDSVKTTKNIYMPVILNRYNKKRKYYCWTIAVKTGEKIGMAGLTDSTDRFKIGEIYYKINPVYWNKGYGTEVSKGLIRFGFESLKLHRVEAGVATENKASVRVLEKSGMKREGLHTKILPIRGEWKDNYHYAIVEEDYFKPII